MRPGLPKRKVTVWGYRGPGQQAGADAVVDLRGAGVLQERFVGLVGFGGDDGPMLVHEILPLA